MEKIEIDEVDFNEHIGHKIQLLKVGDTLVEIKCLTCNKVLGYNWDVIEETEEREH